VYRRHVFVGILPSAGTWTFDVLAGAVCGSAAESLALGFVPRSYRHVQTLRSAFRFAFMSPQKHKNSAVIPLPEEWCGEVTEERISIRPVLDHFDYDFRLWDTVIPTQVGVSYGESHLLSTAPY
jgi:hypothetical protein